MRINTVKPPTSILETNFVVIQLEDDERNRVDELKQSERQKATDDLEKWKEEQQRQAQRVRMH